MINGEEQREQPQAPQTPCGYDSIYNLLTRRLRAAKTIFEDRVKLILIQEEQEHWAFLKKPYLLVVPTQTRAPRVVEKDVMSFESPHSVTLIAQFDGRDSEQAYLAMNEIDCAEQQLMFALCNWRPRTNFEPTMYGGMRIQGIRLPAVKVAYLFTLSEQMLFQEEAPIFESDECVAEEVILDHINVNLSGPYCYCPPELGPAPKITVTSGRSLNGCAYTTGPIFPQPPTEPEDDEVDYSLAEQATPRKWIDGRTVFQKTIVGGTGSEFPHGIANLDFVIGSETTIDDCDGEPPKTYLTLRYVKTS